MKKIKCTVVCVNSNCEPDLYFVEMECSNEDIQYGVHYSKAKEAAEEAGFEPYLVFDEWDRYGDSLWKLQS